MELPKEIKEDIEKEADKYLISVGSVHNKNVIRHDFIEGAEIYAKKYLTEVEAHNFTRMLLQDAHDKSHSKHPF